jgi:hypothetical protein
MKTADNHNHNQVQYPKGVCHALKSAPKAITSVQAVSAILTI